MCMQDYQMAQRTTFQKRDYVIGADGFGMVPDMSRAYLFFVLDAGTNVKTVSIRPTTGAVMDAPADQRFGVTSLNCKWYSVLSCGAFARQGLWTDGVANDVHTVYYLEMDIETYTRTLSLEG